MNIYVVIPARGGSKGILKKNIKLLKNRPLIDYSIKYSKACNLVNRTVVTTDSHEIAEISKKCGAEVPFIRPANLAEDSTQDFPVFLHALNELETIYKETIDVIVLLRPTSPLRPINLIERGIELLNRFPLATSIRSVTKSSEHPYRQWLSKDDYIIGYESNILEPYNIPRQSLPEAYFQTGDIEIIRRETILNGSISGLNVLPLFIDPIEMLDIDIENDWLNLEKKIAK